MILTQEEIATIDLSNLEAWKIVRTDPTKTVLIAKENLKRSQELEYAKGIAWSYGNLGAANVWLSDYEKALSYCFQAVDLLNQCGEFKQEVQLHYYLSIVFYFLGDSAKQLEHAERSLARASDIDDLHGQANAFNGIGTVHYTNGDNEAAIENLNKGLELAIQGEDLALLARIYDGLGNSYTNLEKYDEALQYMNKALEILEKIDVKQTLSYAHDGTGTIYAKLKNYPKALEHFTISFKLREEMGFKDGMGTTKLHMGETYSLAGDNLSAVQSFKDALEIGNELGSFELIYKSHEGLSELYEDMGNLTLFVKHFKAFHSAKQSFFNEAEDKKIKAFELKGRLDQIQKEKDDLERKNAQLENYFKDVQTLSSIGQEITSTLDIEAIFQIIYERINSLMDAQGIFIGVCNYDENKLEVKLAIDGGTRDAYFEYSLDDRKLSNYTVKTGKHVHIGDYQNEVTKYIKEGEVLLHNAPESVIVLPLSVKETTIGILYAQSDKKNAFTKHHLNILTSFASYLSIAIDNADLYEKMDAKVQERTVELQKTYENSELLNKIGQELISTLDFESVFERLYQNVNKLMDASVFGVRLVDFERAVIEYPFEYEKGVRLEPGEADFNNENNYSAVCIKKNEPILINDNRAEYSKWVNEIFVVDGEMPESLIFYPLEVDGKVIGCISSQSFAKNAYTPYHLTIVKTLAQYTSLALKNAKNYEVMEDKVRERTKEITKTYEDSKLLSEIGKSITSQLSVEAIIEVAYKNINQLMDAEGFGIGIYKEDANALAFPGYIESGQRLDGADYDLNDMDRMACVCFNRDEELILNDFENDYSKYINKYLEPRVGRSVSSLIYLPLKAKGRKIGVITVQSFKTNSYSEYQVNMLRSIALYTGIGMDNASLYEQMDEKVQARTAELQTTYDNSELLNKIGQELISSLDFENVFERLYANVNKLMDATVFGVRIYDKEANMIRYPFEYEKGRRLGVMEATMDNDNNYSVVCIKKDEPILINDNVTEYKKWVNEIVVMDGEMPSSLIFFPLRGKDGVLGVISVQSFDKNAYSPYHLTIVQTLAQYTVLALENARSFEVMEEKVKERTAEIQKAFENTDLLSRISKEIAAELSVEDIISKVYSNVNNLMDAEVFGIAIHRPESDDLFFQGAMEKGTRLSDFSYPLSDEKISTISFKQNKEILINDWKNEYQQYLEEDYQAVEGDMPESMIYIPLSSKGNLIGVLTVQSFEVDAYSDNDLNILRAISVSIGSAIENANLYKGLEDRVKERTEEINQAYQNTKLMSQISKDIAQSLEIETIISSVYKNINTLMDATCFGVGIFDPEKKRISMPGFIENGAKMEEFGYELSDERLATYCFNNNEEIVISNYFEEYSKYIKGLQAPVSGKDSTSIVYIPISLKDKIVGLLTVQSYEVAAYTEYHVDILRSLATTIGAALENARLYENMEDKVRERTAELYQQKEIIEEKNKHITDSIIYAKRIQDATLPSAGLVRSHLPESFVLFKPKDIVSGDFYWISAVGDEVLFSVVDCTGHGVPGAFLSLIGHNSLNQIVNELSITQPSEILYTLDKIVYKTLQNNLETTNIKDGMDMSICSYNKITKKLQFSGAYNPLYLVREGELTEIKGDKIAIGSGQTEKKYTNNEIQLESGDCIYLSSDGYADQFGGEKGKKFKYSNFKKLLVMNHLQSMSRQHDILEMTIDEWQGDLEQLDDVCVIGVRID